MAASSKPPLWRRAFLRALAATASVTLAAGRAGVDRSSVYAFRRRDAGFAAAWARALAKGRAALTGGTAPARMVRGVAGETLAVRSSRTGKVCMMRVGEGRWSAAKERTFLALLAATANARHAAEAVGLSATAIFNRRQRWPAFRAAWAAALDEGRVRIEARLIAEAAAPPELPPAAGGVTPAPFREALELFKVLEARRVREQRAAGEAGAGAIDFAAMRERLLDQIARMAGDDNDA